MPSEPRRQSARWSGVALGCLIVVVALAALIWLLTSITFGEHGVSDSNGWPVQSISTASSA